MTEFRIAIRALSFLGAPTKSEGFRDPENILMVDAAKVRAMRANPDVDSLDEPAQLLAIADDIVAGQHCILPMTIIADRARYRAACGSGLMLSENWRNSQLALRLIVDPGKTSPDGIIIGCGLSKTAITVYRGLRFLDFQLPRLVMIARVGPIARMLNLPVALQRILAHTGTALLAPYRWFVHQRARLPRSISWCRVEQVPDDIETLTSMMTERFRHRRDRAWWHWQLHHRFSSDPQSRTLMWEARDGQNKLLAVAMGKLRFHPVASQRGLREVMMGSITEWQSNDLTRLNHSRLVLAAVAELVKEGADIVEVCSDDPALQRHLRRHFCIASGALNYVLMTNRSSALRSHEGFDFQRNWRIRPADGDNGLS